MTVVFLSWYLRVTLLLKINDMTQKDIRAQFKRETGRYSPFETDARLHSECEYKEYAKWLEEKVIALDQNVYDLKLKMLRMIENPVNMY